MQDTSAAAAKRQRHGQFAIDACPGKGTKPGGPRVEGKVAKMCFAKLKARRATITGFSFGKQEHKFMGLA